MNNRVAVTLLLTPLIGGCCGSSSSPQEDKPNVILIITDQWRRQAIGYMDEDPVITPNFDKLASKSVSFDNAVATVPVSGPNRAVIMTGKYTINNGVWANKVPMDREEESVVGRVFKQAGYQTGYIGKWHLNGYDDMAVDPATRQDFDYWYQSLGHNHFKSWYYAPEVDSLERFAVDLWGPTHETNLAIDFINEKSSGDDPYCLVISYAPPHTGGGKGFEDRYQPGKKLKYGYGYAAPAQYEALYTDDYSTNKIRPNIKPTGNYEGTSDYAHAVPGYFGAVTSIDDEVGRLIDHLEASGEIENTIIIVTSDHGEMMGSHGLMTKGVPFEESVGVPMIISWQGKIRPSRESAMISSVDIFPTMIDLVGGEIPKSADGTSFAPLLLTGVQDNLPKYAYTVFNFGGVGESARAWRAVHSDDYVYVLAASSKLKTNFLTQGYALFDMKKDPYQLSPITRGEGYDDIIDEYHSRLLKQLDLYNDEFMEIMWSQEEQPSKPSLNKENYDPNYSDVKHEARSALKKSRKTNS